MGHSTRTNLVELESLEFSLLSEDQKAAIFNGMLETLQRTGADVHHDGARALLKKHGCTVDGIRVFIPPHLVREALSTLPPTTRVYAWDGDSSRDVRIEKNRSYFGPGPTLPNFIDTDTLERRKYLRRDASLVARVCDALPNIGFVQSLGSISDTTTGLADVYEFGDMIQRTTKPVMGWSFDRGGCRDLHRIAIAMAGGEEAFRRRPNYIHYGEPISPLVSDYHAIDKCMYCAENWIPQVYSPCAIGGATVPATHAGQLVVAMSESMVGVVVAQLLNPGTCVIIGGVQSIFDMRYTIYSYGAPELSLLSAALTEMCKWVGLPMFSQSGCTDAKVLEVQSAIEAALSINMAMLSGANLMHDNGYSESGLTGNVFQLVMDDEIIGMARTINRGMQVNNETLAVDVINRVGPGGHYLEEEHTFKWFRQHWQPSLMDRRSYEDWEAAGRLTMNDRILAKTRDIINNHEGAVGKVPPDVNKDIQRIFEEAEDRVSRTPSEPNT